MMSSSHWTQQQAATVAALKLAPAQICLFKPLAFLSSQLHCSIWQMQNADETYYSYSELLSQDTCSSLPPQDQGQAEHHLHTASSACRVGSCCTPLLPLQLQHSSSYAANHASSCAHAATTSAPAPRSHADLLSACYSTSYQHAAQATNTALPSFQSSGARSTAEKHQRKLALQP
jgi:hypothetical protein